MNELDIPEVRVPPQNLEAEQSVLGALFLGKEACDKIFAKVREEDFYREAHRRIFRGAFTIWSRKEPVDIQIMANELKQSGDFERVGGFSGLTG